MDHNALLDMTAEFGYQIAMCGAETFRVEDSICRILNAYGIQGEVFAIPNCLTVSILSSDGKPMTRMRRIGFHGNDLDGVEQFSSFSRRVCAEKPDISVATQWLKETKQNLRQYKLPLYLFGNCLGALGFCILFGGSYIDCLCSGVCGILVGLLNRFMDQMKTNQLFRTISISFIMALLAYTLNGLHIAENPDTVIIGALMILVPGLLFTNALRDIIYGDTNSGLNRIVQVFLIAVGIALGTGVALGVSSAIWGAPQTASIIEHPLLLQSIACFVSGIGFFILFNIQGKGGFLCALGGLLTWLCYYAILKFGGHEIFGYFCATAFASLYAEIMARIRKCPAIAYLVISAFPLIPGAGVYYTMTHAVANRMDLFAKTGMRTLAIAGAMAVGIVFATSLVRFWMQIKSKS